MWRQRLRKGIRKRDKSEDDKQPPKILQNLDKYIEDLAGGATEINAVIDALMSADLSEPQKKALKSCLRGMARSDYTLCKQLNLSGSRVEELKAMLGDN